MRNPSNLDDFTDVWLTHLPVGGTIVVAAPGEPDDLITLTYLGAGSWGDIVESDYVIVGSTDTRIAAMLDAVDDTAGDEDGLTLWLARGQYLRKRLRIGRNEVMCTGVRMDQRGKIWVETTDGSAPEEEIFAVRSSAFEAAQVHSERRRTFTTITNLVTAIETLDAFGNDYTIAATMRDNPFGEPYRVWTITTAAVATMDEAS